MPKLTKRDLRMMDLICSMETSIVADKLGITVKAVNSRFSWIRKKRIEATLFLNTCLSYERKCPDLRRRITPTSKRPLEKMETEE